LRAATGLPDDERELVIVFSLRDFIAGLRDEVTQLRRQQTQLVIRLRRRFLDERKGVDEPKRELLPAAQGAADREVLQGALRLRAPQHLARHIDASETVSFLACVHDCLPPM
jgi:hypothetical protein